MVLGLCYLGKHNFFWYQRQAELYYNCELSILQDLCIGKFTETLYTYLSRRTKELQGSILVRVESAKDTLVNSLEFDLVND